ncbi:TPA: FAD-binding protein [Candidatus Avigastranaerophilus faecigallinarum]|nr:FAD-binding protein [Candidatus Avigastranaerophilus faecigallinarum]
MLNTLIKLTNNTIKTMESIVGKENVLSDYEELLTYSTDSTNITNPNEIAEVVVFVENVQQVSKIMKYAYSKAKPVIARAAGTNLCGACLPKKGGIIVDFAKMNKILEISKDNLICKVEPGVVIEDLQKEVEKLDLFYPPDPSNLKASMIGGSIGLSSGGPHTFKYGATKDFVIDLEVVLSDGTIMHTGSSCSKDVTGYNMTQLFVGSEGTLGIITQATIRLIPKPEAKRVMLAYFDTLEDTSKTVNDIISNLITPSVIDLMDNNTLKTIESFYPCNLKTDKTAALLIEIDGFKEILDSQYNKIIEICNRNNSSYIQTASTKEEEERIWISRRSSFGATAKLAPNVLTEDVVVPRENIVPLVKGIWEICKKYELKTCIMGHIGDGNIHPNIALDLRNPVERYNFDRAKTELFELALSLNGRLSGEHGIGCEKSEFISKALDPNNLEYMKKIKKLFDPKNILNPGKIF